jgi:copper chaperone NosL
MMPRLFSLLLMAASLGGCDDPNLAKEPIWNKQPCDHCHMLLSDPRYAAELSTPAGDRWFFDDIGCLVAFMVERKLTHARAWVREGSRWRDASQARYARGAQTPMGYGFVPSPNGELDFRALLRGAAARAVHAPAGAP